MSYYAEIGESVLYTGDLSFSTNDSTTSLMKKHLVKDKWYIVSDVRNFCIEADEYNIVKHYRVKEFWAPCDSFKTGSDFIKNISRNKYNLK